MLQVSIAADAVIAAIEALNQGVQLSRRSSYVRVLVPERCTVARRVIEAQLGYPFRLPADLERIMPAFTGRFSVSEDEASWTLTRGEGER